MGAGQLQPKRNPDIARSDCPVPHLGQRRRAIPVNAHPTRCATSAPCAVLPANRAPPEASILRTWRCPCCNIHRERAGYSVVTQSIRRRHLVLGQRGSRHLT